MLSSLDSRTQRFLNDLGRIQNRVDAAQRKVTTGLRVQQVSDDPDVVSAILRARSGLASVQQIQFNLGRVQLEVDTAESTIQTAVRLFEKVRTMGAQGATATASTSMRRQLAGQVEQSLEQMVGLSRTTVEGRYIFSGDSDQVPPYSIDLALNPPVTAYAGSGVSRLVEHPNGATFTVARTAQQIFDDADPQKNIFSTFTALRDALLADDQIAVETALATFTPAGGHLNQQLAYYGSAQSRVKEATEYVSRQVLGFQSQLATLQEADMAEAILEFQSAKYNQEAALQVRGLLPRSTLFDYIG